MTSTTSSIASLTTATQAAATKKTTGTQTIDSASFLKLLTTQMTNQDPTAPMDTNTMTTQLSQITQTSGIQEMNASLKSLLSEVTGNRIGDAASWIGKAALVSGQTAQPLGDGSYQGQVTLPSAAATVSISLKDAEGNIVHSETGSNVSAGAFQFAWDGKDSTGAAVSGPLTMVVSATAKDGSSISPTTAVWQTVTGVNSPAGGSAAQLTTSVGTVAPSDVISLS
jgi:flagellar basal-body rod modification protein FlgD